ncbi:MAG: ribosomal subunit interface protein [Bacteroidota bacterium]|jgi:putative sigma-54 modulation protein
MKIQTQSVHFDADVKLLEFVERKVGKLSTFHDHIVSTEVYLRLDNHAQVHDKFAEIKIQVPGHTFIAKEVYRTFEQAIDEATDSLRRQLLKHKERQRG